jgi:hypothetical protein
MIPTKSPPAKSETEDNKMAGEPKAVENLSTNRVEQ